MMKPFEFPSFLWFVPMNVLFSNTTLQCSDHGLFKDNWIPEYNIAHAPLRAYYWHRLQKNQSPFFQILEMKIIQIFLTLTCFWAPEHAHTSILLQSCLLDPFHMRMRMRSNNPMTFLDFQSDIGLNWLNSINKKIKSVGFMTICHSCFTAQRSSLAPDLDQSTMPIWYRNKV